MIDYKKYPANWLSEIRPRILKRAGNKCEFCGVPNYALIMRSEIEPKRYVVLNQDDFCYYLDGEIVRMSELPEEFERDKFTKVVLTIAHLDQNVENNGDGNLKALCQRCHLVHDRPWTMKKIKSNRQAKKRRGQLPLFTVNE